MLNRSAFFLQETWYKMGQNTNINSKPTDTDIALTL